MKLQMIITIWLILQAFLISGSGQQAGEIIKGPLIEEFYVSSEKSNAVYTHVLEAQKYYIIQASGVFSYWNGRTDGADAYYDYDDPYTKEELDYRPLQIDDQSMYDIAKKNGDSLTYNPSHFYETWVVGDGKPLKLHIWDIYPESYADNHGSLDIKIYEASYVKQPIVPQIPIFLASFWTVKEYGPMGNWDGMWIRRPGTNTFDASWSGGSITDVIDIKSIVGDKITLHRRGINGDYIGTISSDGRGILGTATFYDPGEVWIVSIPT